MAQQFSEREKMKRQEEPRFAPEPREAFIQKRKLYFLAKIPRKKNYVFFLHFCNGRLLAFRTYSTKMEVTNTN